MYGKVIATDHVGSVRYRRTFDGFTETPKYYPYGQERGTTPQNQHKFRTYYRDGFSNLDYADQRYYANAMGRFMTADPHVATDGLASPQSWNRYAYVEDDPVNYLDPLGLDKREPCPNGDCAPAPPASVYYPPLWPIGGWPNAGGDFGGSLWPDQPKRDLSREAREKLIEDSIGTAVDRAIWALKNPGCRGLFGTAADPSKVLGSLHEGGFIYAVLGVQGAAQATYEGQVYDPERKEWVWTRSNIELKISAWFAMSPDDRARTLIHELGHVFNVVNNLGGSECEYDWDVENNTFHNAAQNRNAEREKKCIR